MPVKDVKRAIQQRRLLRTMVTKEVKDAEASLEVVNNENKDKARKTVAKLTSRQSELNDLDGLILDNVEDDQYEAELGKVYDYRDSLTDVIASLEGKLADLSTGQSERSRHNTTGVSEIDTEIRRERLPEMELTKFDGDPLNWQEFWDDFKISVDDRNDLTVITKFKLLRKCLVGNAAAACKGYRLTEANYAEVKSVLGERYGDKETAVALHLEALVQLKPAASQSVSELVRIRDECETNIRALGILGFMEDTFGQLFAPIILSKLPKYVRLDIRKQKKQSGQPDWTMQMLREALSVEIELRTSNEREYFGERAETSRETARSSKFSGSMGDKGWKQGGTASALFVGGSAGVRGKLDKPTRPCIFCGDAHFHEDCVKYPNVESRQARLSPDHCLRCLKTGHRKIYCRTEKRSCYYCGRDNHHKALCLKKFGKPPEDDAQNQKTLFSDSKLNPGAPEFAPDNVYSVNTISAGDLRRPQRGIAILESALVMVVGETGSCMARLVGDTGSTKSYMSGKLAKKIGAKRVGFKVTAVGRFGETARQTRQLAVHEFVIALRNGERKVVEMDVEEHLAPNLTLFPLDLTQIQPYCKVGELAEMVVEHPTDVEIDILLGLDYYYSIVGQHEVRCGNGLVLKESSVGYIVTGYKQTSSTDQENTHQLLVIGDRTRDPFDLEKFWRLEEIGIKDNPGLNEDEAALKQFHETVKVVDGRYQVQWPFKSDSPDLPDNYSLALRRLNSVLRKVKADSSLLEVYSKTFRTQEELGVIEKAPVEPDGPVHHLCHHIVAQPNSITTPYRVVFDASAKPNEHCTSLNEAMYRGPVILSDLCGMLLRFRLSPVAIMSDIEKAFLQIMLQRHHRDYTRFLWLKDPQKPATPGNIEVYRYTRVLFGATASPFLLAASINHHMKRVGGPTAEDIMNNTYVDNVFTCQPTTEAALEYYREAKSLFDRISMNLREWYSNDQQFMSGIAEPDRGKKATPSVLGLKWSLERDKISCTIGNLQTCGVITKRVILKSIASVYDPCGWFGPVTVRGKLMLQDLWAAQIGWDNPVEPVVLSAWKDLAGDLQKMPTFSLPRHVGIDDDDERDIQLHGFCDASAKAYGAAVYLRVQSKSMVRCNLIFAKSRVAPLRRELSIPRLELIAALVGSQLVDFISKQLPIQFSAKTIWSDSKCILGWVQQSTVTTVFVGNRVKQIKSLPDLNFKYVPTGDNPADLLSRGSELLQLMENDQWWHGPSWLVEDKLLWPMQDVVFQKEPTETESNDGTTPMGDLCALITETPQQDHLFDLQRYSSLRKLVKVTCWVLRGLDAMVPKFVEKQYPMFKMPVRLEHLTKRELAESQKFWEVRVQKQHLPVHIRNSKSKVWRQLQSQLGVYVDSEGLVRCKGRFQHAKNLGISAKFPKYLPKVSRFTDLVAQNCHERAMHSGLKQTLASIRSEYWIPHGRTVVKRILRECRLCRLYTASPFTMPDPPPLPSYRVSIHKPFAFVGLDYLGPLQIREQNDSKKVWIALYTCGVIRAIYLDVVKSLSTEHFLLSLRRFVASHGKPNLIVSDNAKQFRMADRVIKKFWLDILKSDAVQAYCANESIEWKFITELSPWMGGFYERMVQPVKDALRKSLGHRTVSLEELQTLVLEVAAVVNSRPLLYSEDEPLDNILTPAHLMFRNQELFPEITNVEEFRLKPAKADELLEGWKKIQRILRHFWDSWRNQYLLSLRERHIRLKQRATSEIEPQVGMTVLIKDNLPRGMWRLGRIEALIESNDGKVRSVKVRLANGNILTRPLKLLCPLESPGRQEQEKEPQQPVSSEPKRRQTSKRKAAAEAERLFRQQLQDD